MGVAAWVNGVVAWLPLCGLPGCYRDNDNFFPIGYGLGVLASLTALAYVPIRSRGRSGKWLLLAALVAGISAFGPYYAIASCYTHEH